MPDPSGLLNCVSQRCMTQVRRLHESSRHSIYVRTSYSPHLLTIAKLQIRGPRPSTQRLLLLHRLGRTRGSMN